MPYAYLGLTNSSMSGVVAICFLWTLEGNCGLEREAVGSFQTECFAGCGCIGGSSSRNPPEAFRFEVCRRGQQGCATRRADPPWNGARNPIVKCVVHTYGTSHMHINKHLFPPKRAIKTRDMSVAAPQPMRIVYRLSLTIRDEVHMGAVPTYLAPSDAIQGLMNHPRNSSRSSSEPVTVQ
jgi:hypothetical protein